MTRPSLRIRQIISALEHSATSEWSARITPEDSALLLVLLADYYSRLNAPR